MGASPLAGTRVVLGVGGGIAAYKAVELLRLLTGAGADVDCVLTEAACEFVAPLTFTALSGRPAQTKLFGAADPIPHTRLGQSADLVVVAPATADLIGRIAAGLADDLLTNTILATRAPLVVAAAMHTEMWEGPPTRRNVAQLRADGIAVVDPDVGLLAGGDTGQGRMAEPAAIFAACERALAARLGGGVLDGAAVLVTAGGTREPIDAVRYVGNRSSGRMGFALADEAAALGADVTVVAANVGLARSPRVRYEDVETAAELHDACLALFPAADVLLMAAAVADFAPAAPDPGKLKKGGRDGLTVALEPTVDVLAALAAARRPGQVLVGFAAEHGDGAVDYGRGKLERKGVDAIVVNDVSGEGIGFDAVDNEVTIITAAGETHVPRTTKGDVARAILSTVETLRTPSEAPAT